MLQNGRHSITACKPYLTPIMQSYPKPSQLPPTPCTEYKPEPIIDGELEHEPVPERWNEPAIAPEPDPSEMSDQVHKMATLYVTVGLLMEYEGMEEDPANTQKAEAAQPISEPGAEHYLIDLWSTHPVPF
ncbi:hypothetical protein DPX16_5927 [Anabarilius grahami]|uniref:Uncharacterized protein n=1 Tax=Anabarilius grahami TaxID=495550 RepID=A0A3N0Y325_ANAGA|nr:hypothetical protein DPX16_5927 [Anabarilius grahami]